MPRPKKTADTVRLHRVHFRLNDTEHAALCRRAERLGIPTSEFARLKTTDRHGVRVGGRMAEPPALAALRADLMRVGVNLNQIARRLNMTGEHEPQELRDACAHLDEIFVRLLADLPMR